MAFCGSPVRVLPGSLAEAEASQCLQSVSWLPPSLPLSADSARPADSAGPWRADGGESEVTTCYAGLETVDYEASAGCCAQQVSAEGPTLQSLSTIEHQQEAEANCDDPPAAQNFVESVEHCRYDNAAHLPPEAAAEELPDFPPKQSLHVPCDVPPSDESQPTQREADPKDQEAGWVPTGSWRAAASWKQTPPTIPAVGPPAHDEDSASTQQYAQDQDTIAYEQSAKASHRIPWLSAIKEAPTIDYIGDGDSVLTQCYSGAAAPSSVVAGSELPHAEPWFAMPPPRSFPAKAKTMSPDQAKADDSLATQNWGDDSLATQYCGEDSLATQCCGDNSMKLGPDMTEPEPLPTQVYKGDGPQPLMLEQQMTPKQPPPPHSWSTGAIAALSGSSAGILDVEDSDDDEDKPAQKLPSSMLECAGLSILDVPDDDSDAEPCCGPDLRNDGSLFGAFSSDTAVQPKQPLTKQQNPTQPKAKQAKQLRQPLVHRKNRFAKLASKKLIRSLGFAMDIPREALLFYTGDSAGPSKYITRRCQRLHGWSVGDARDKFRYTDGKGCRRNYSMGDFRYDLGTGRIRVAGEAASSTLAARRAPAVSAMQVSVEPSTPNGAPHPSPRSMPVGETPPRRVRGKQAQPASSSKSTPSPVPAPGALPRKRAAANMGWTSSGGLETASTVPLEKKRAADVEAASSAASLRNRMAVKGQGVLSIVMEAHELEAARLEAVQQAAQGTAVEHTGLTQVLIDAHPRA